MWQKGPGEGYHAAKDDALELDPTLRCEGARYQGRIIGYVVRRAGKSIGTGRISRDAWAEALGKLREERGLDWRGKPKVAELTAGDERG